jgi:hypothetical protein
VALLAIIRWPPDSLFRKISFSSSLLSDRFGIESGD